MEREQCPTYNGTLETLTLTRKVFFFYKTLDCFLYARNTQVTFAEKPQMKINRSTKTWISNSYLIGQSFEG